MKNIFALLTISIFAISCVTMPGDLHYSESQAEGTKQLSINLGWLYGAYLKMGVYKTSKMDKDKAVLEVCIYDDTIGFNKNLLINIDGEKTSFESFDKLSLKELDVNNKTCFKKRYDVALAYLQKMVNGKNVWVQVTTNNSTFVEGEFSKDAMNTAKRGFVKFLSQINMTTGEIYAKPPTNQ